MLPSFCTDTIVIFRPTYKSERGDLLPDWSHVTQIPVTGCTVQPAGTSLSQDGRVLGTMDGLTAYLPPGTDIRVGDRVRWNGFDYTIYGEPRVWPSPTNRVSHILCNLRRWTG